jgi:hypothetical protein
MHITGDSGEQNVVKIGERWFSRFHVAVPWNQALTPSKNRFFRCIHGGIYQILILWTFQSSTKLIVNDCHQCLISTFSKFKEWMSEICWPLSDLWRIYLVDIRETVECLQPPTGQSQYCKGRRRHLTRPAGALLSASAEGTGAWKMWGVKSESPEVSSMLNNFHENAWINSGKWEIKRGVCGSLVNLNTWLSQGCGHHKPIWEPTNGYVL